MFDSAVKYAIWGRVQLGIVGAKIREKQTEYANERHGGTAKKKKQWLCGDFYRSCEHTYIDVYTL